MSVGLDSLVLAEGNFEGNNNLELAIEPMTPIKFAKYRCFGLWRPLNSTGTNNVLCCYEVSLSFVITIETAESHELKRSS